MISSPRDLTRWLALTTIAAALWVGPLPNHARADGRSDAAARLRQQGLSRLGQSSLWISRNEVDVRRRLASLSELRDAIVATEKHLAERFRQNGELWAARVAAEQRWQKLKGDAGKDSARRKELEKLLQDLRKTAVPPAQLPAHPEIRNLLIDWTNHRHELALSILTIRRKTPRLTAEYERLRLQSSVREPLQQLGAPHRLGPVRNYAGQLPRLNEYESHAFTNYVPLYRQHDRTRVGALIDERIPFTFTWKTSSEPTFITSNMADAIGLNIPADTPRTTLSVASDRRLAVVRVKIPTIRFGNCVLRDVDAYVLPPEGEDLGAQFGEADLKGFAASIDSNQARIVFRRL